VGSSPTEDPGVIVLYVFVAQLAEQGPLKALVVGSSPTEYATKRPLTTGALLTADLSSETACWSELWRDGRD
jgi:hypothetical protein